MSELESPRLNDFDQAARYAIRHLDPVGFFRWLLGEKFLAAWKFVSWLDTQAVPFPGGPDLRCDTVAGFTRHTRRKPGPPLAIVVEFMSRTRTSTLRRVLRYAFQVQEDCPFQLEPRVEFTVLGALVNLTGGEQSPILQEKAPGTGGLGFRGRFQVRTLARESAEELLREIEAGQISRALLVWLPLMVGGDSRELVQRVRTVLEFETNRSLRGDIVGIALVLAELVERRDLWKDILGGIDMERSVTVMEWEARGEARGQVLKARQFLLRALEVRSGGSVPPAFREIVNNQSNLDTLGQWFDTVLESPPQETLASLAVRLGWAT